MPILLLGFVLAWLAFAEKSVGREAGTGVVGHVQSAPLAWSAPPTIPMFIVAVGPERTEQLRDLLSGEASLRVALGEDVRLAEVIEAANRQDAERIAQAVRTPLVLGPALLAVVVQ